MSKDEDDDLHREIMERADQGHTADFDNREEALDDLRFRAGGMYQWDADTLREREEDGRPVITVNMIPHYVRQVTNDARANRPSIKVRGVDDESDPKTAEVLEGLTRHIEDQSEAVSKCYIPGIDNAATCGIGNWRITTKYADDDTFGQDIFIENIPNPLAVIWDPFAKSPDRSDANWCFVVDDIPEDEYEKKYPDKPISDFSLTGTSGGFWRDQGSKTVRVAEYWCKEPVKKKIGLTTDGKTIDLTDIPAPSVKFLGIVKTREVESHKIVSYMVSGVGLLTKAQPWAGRYIPIVAVIGEEVHVGEHRVRYGIVRHAKDPQRLYNLWRSLQAETIAQQPKSPFIATGKQIEKYKGVWKLANKRSLPYLPYDPDGTAPPPQRQAPPQASRAMTEEAMLSVDEMKATTGIYDAALGNRSNETSGVGIEARKKESDTSNSHFPDNLALSIRHTGRILVDLIPEIYDTEKVVRLLNEDGTEKMQPINKLVQTPEGPKYIHDLSQGKYDVTVKTGPSYQTRRQESADFLMQFMQTAPDSAQFVMDLLAKNLDAPGSEELAKRFRLLLKKQHPEMFPDDEEPPPPPTEQDKNNALMAHAQLTEQIATTQLKEAQAEDAEMDAALKGMQVAQLAVQGPINMAVNQAVMDVLKKFGVSDSEQPGVATQPPAGMQSPAQAPAHIGG